MKNDYSDPVIDEIREIRHRISARFDHDPKKLVEHYAELDQNYKDRLYSPKNSEKSENSAA